MAEIEMCSCGCGTSKEDTITKLQRANNCTREEAEQQYNEAEQEMKDMTPEQKDLLRTLSFLVTMQEDDAK